MDFSYDWLSAQIRHDLNKFLLFFIAYFPCFGPNKKNPKCRNKLNLIVSTCRSFGCPLYSHVQNVPALVSYDMMEGKRHTNKPKAMDDDDNTTETTKQQRNNKNNNNHNTTETPKQQKEQQQLNKSETTINNETTINDNRHKQQRNNNQRQQRNNNQRQTTQK